MYLICTFPAAHIDIGDYPAIKKYFESGEWSTEIPDGYGKLRLEQTGQKHKIGEYEFTSRKKTSNKWFETQDPIAYMDDFNQQKIIYGQFRQGEFCLDNNKMMLSSNEYMLVCAKHNLTSLLNYLNSPLCYFYQKCIMNTLGGNTTIAQKSIFIEIPVPQIDNYDANFEDFCKKIKLSDEEISFIRISL